MRRRRALVVGLAGLTTACAGPTAAPVLTAQPAASPTPAPRPTPVATAQPIGVPTPVPAPTPVPTATPVVDPSVALEVRLWNGAAEVQIDGRTIEPGQLRVPRGPH